MFYSILGMHLFGCKFSLRLENGDTIPDRKNFDSLLWAIVTVFQVRALTVLSQYHFTMSDDFKKEVKKAHVITDTQTCTKPKAIKVA